jgi:hypothetical protein
MAEQNCENCGFRSKYDQNPKSFLGRLWRWHANWCPGWKSYIYSIPEEKRMDLVKKYNMQKFA